MAWPTVAELKLELGVTVSTPAQDQLLARAIAAAIDRVELDVMGGNPADVGDRFADTIGEPPPALEQAALLLGVAAAKAPDAPHGIAGVFDTGALYVARSNPHYQGLIRGWRRAFGIA